MLTRSHRIHSIHPTLVPAIVVALTLSVAPAITAQQADVAEPLAGEESSVTETALVEINGALQRIAAALEAQKEERGLEIMMKRIELSERRLQPLEARLREHRSERESLEAQRSYAERNLANLIDRGAVAGAEMSADHVEDLIAQLEAEIESVDARIATVDGEIAVLENETSRQRRDVEDWQAYVDRLIAALGGS